MTVEFWLGAIIAAGFTWMLCAIIDDVHRGDDE